MSLRHVISLLTRSIIVLALVATTYLYLYPVWQGCAFPSTTKSTHDGFRDTIARHFHGGNDTLIAPFRLLVLADPQLEGDSSLPDPEDALSAKLKSHATRLRAASRHELKDVAREALEELVTVNIPNALWTLRKSLDLFGNDYYLAHIYRTLHWWAMPTHVTVLGDLIGSQWTVDEEFERRGWRYWNRVFAGTSMVDAHMMDMHTKDPEEQTSVHIESHSSSWANKLINIAGNHDIGYAGDISPARIERFERTFGRTNWDVRFTYPTSWLPDSYTTNSTGVPSLQLIVLNSMLLDTPAFSTQLQDKQYDYINGLISQRLSPVSARNNTFTLLLTHVPLYKPAGICVDGPLLEYWDFSDADGKFFYGGLREQNHLSEHTSHQGILESIFGMSGNDDANEGGIGRRGLILTGHDHEGCDVVHYIVKTDEPDRKNEARGVSGNDHASHLVQIDKSDVSEPEPNSEIPDQSPHLPWHWHVNRTADLSYPSSSFTPHTSLREITLRSMMGAYSGTATLLSLWYDFQAESWTYEIQTCPLGVQHFWWTVHILDLIAAGCILGWTVVRTAQFRSRSRSRSRFAGADGAKKMKQKAEKVD